ncbi:hypothetical protein XNC3_1660005 [Xenorhabdus nematophila F1]|nr:hypothetical protein XNC3_1660005 [Xenorhabdus nematophila F1]CEE93467.1 hypothetical protein XNA1_3810005 [Xenorhabdus nematophila str. Anatoliense]CEF32213.1 hypothetical protein XNW1_4270004 [Xenorhabdus nematophila str. Websteri]
MGASILIEPNNAPYYAPRDLWISTYLTGLQKNGKRLILRIYWGFMDFGRR